MKYMSDGKSNDDKTLCGFFDLPSRHHAAPSRAYIFLPLTTSQYPPISAAVFPFK